MIRARIVISDKGWVVITVIKAGLLSVIKAGLLSVIKAGLLSR